ncbi:MAG: Holliday junction resolvase RuvX [Phycisphaerales bacterium]
MSDHAPPVRHLALDLGDKRTGVAVGDTITRLVSPAGVVELPLAEGPRGEPLIDELVRLAREHEAHALVVGLPLNMDDSEGPRAKLVRAFAAVIGDRSGLPIVFQDERLTSVEADWQMSRSGLTHKGKKKRRDALAAAAILRDYLGGLEG